VIRFVATVLLVVLGAALPAPAEPPPRAGTQAPVIDFSLPTFTIPDGYRSMLVRGSEAWMTAPNIIDIKGLTMTIFSGDASNRIDTMLLSPAARVLPDEQVIAGDSTLRVINLHDGYEATGENWRYAHKNKTVTLARNVRVVLQAEFKNLLK
jgi:hypothetical protein